MKTSLLATLINMLLVLAIFVVITAIAFLIWTIIWIPIKKKEELESNREQEMRELEKIQAQKGIEWDTYRRLSDELDTLRINYLEQKKKNENLIESNAKLTVDKENLVAKNKELKNQKS